MADSTKWWQDLPCHYHPSWNLSEISQLDLNKLKHHIDRNENDIMVVERLLYAAFLEVPIGSPYNLSRPSVVQAREYLREAEEYIETNLRDNRDASIGYGIVINACRMWTGQSMREWEEKLQILEEEKKTSSKYKYYISAVRAFALSRLGPRWVEEAKVHYEYALEGIPENSQWLYGKASMVGRLLLLNYPNVKFEKSANLGYRDMLNEEKDILEKVLTLNEHFHIARVMYGQVLYNLGETEEAEYNIEKAREAARNNRSIAEIASKYYQRTEQPEKALEILLSLPNASKTAEVHFLLGKLYKSQSYRRKQLSEKKAKWNLALDHFNEALRLDERHYPALSSRAEVNARLGNYEQARKNYADLLSSNLLGNTKLQKDKFFTLKTLLSLDSKDIKKILSDEEYVNYSYEVLEIAVTKYSEEQNGNLTFNDNAKTPIKISTSALKDMCRTQDVQIGFLAKLKLAHFHLLCRRYKEATKLYESLQAETSKVKRENIEVMWGLFKCHLGQKNYKDAARMVRKIREKEQVFYCVAELYADIYTTKAKLLIQLRECINAGEIFSEHPDEATNALSGDMLEDENMFAIARLLENAIEMGSLEACFVFFKINKLQAHFLTSMQIPRIVAKIERVNNEEIVNTQMTFQMENDVGDIDNSTTTKRNVMKDKIEELLTYKEIYEEHGKHFLRGEDFEGFNAYQQFTIINVYTKLSKLRKNLLTFEVVENRKNENADWSIDCEEAVTAVLLTARFLLDHIISDYQVCLNVQNELSLRSFDLPEARYMFFGLNNEIF
ncbi:Interferon-induced protein with tetratricopeptide repeats 1B [Holothuria leucospilota]|uniref:Interferon-induced protein with tetratricopeptide repeats 1B n=1 Tax=Holothuria leucospilota TaxID=206669 RepID=A0A9Q1BVT6_HOLLE|nr:Interferon-induced protein with tetratricopeptide repeats 1B [Holothuria leucospilota]